MTRICTFAQDGNTKDRLVYKKNSVKSVRVYQYKYKNDKVRGKGKLLSNESYDTLGLKIESYSYVTGEFHQQYKYNEYGDLSEEKGYVLNSPVLTTYSYKYDAKNRIIEKAKNGYGGTWLYSYDSLGNQTQIKWYWFGETKLNSYFTDRFEYNDKLKMIKMIRHRADNSVYFYKTYDYDSNGNLIKEVRFERGDTTDTWTYRYDTNGNCVESQIFDKLQGKMVAGHLTSFDDRDLAIFETGKLSFKNSRYYRKYVYEFYK